MADLERRYWQVAAGSEGRDYSHEFLRYGLAFVGGSRQIEAMKTVREGNRIILKRGMSEIVAVGVVNCRDGVAVGSGDKDWLRDFDGWDLEAYCYVDWHTPLEPVKARGLTRSTIQLVHDSGLHKLCDEIIETTPISSILEPEPRPTRLITDEEILSFLIRQGLRVGAAAELTTTMHRIRLLARYYYDNVRWEDVREHEARTFLVIPLLLALGWPEQNLKIELSVSEQRRVDVACFREPYKSPSGNTKSGDCRIIIETKGFSQGLTYAPSQAVAYATEFEQCQTVVVSNGYCYKAYMRDRATNRFPTDKPHAYLNLLNPRDRYPVDPGVGGALEVLRLLLPTSFDNPWLESPRHNEPPK